MQGWLLLLFMDTVQRGLSRSTKSSLDWDHVRKLCYSAMMSHARDQSVITVGKKKKHAFSHGKAKTSIIFVDTGPVESAKVP